MASGEGSSFRYAGERGTPGSPVLSALGLMKAASLSGASFVGMTR